jgi:hypothetical protein
MQKKAWLAIATTSLALCVAGINYFGAHRPASERLAQDPRNEKLALWLHYQYGLKPGTLVVDLRRFSDEAAIADIMRALLHAAEAHKSSRFDRVLLAYRGKPKFMLQGEFFQTIGQEFQHQNPLYTLRTFPQNVYKLDGSQAYGEWTGGWLGVVGKQMEDVNRFAKDWFLNDAQQEDATKRLDR